MPKIYNFFAKYYGKIRYTKNPIVKRARGVLATLAPHNWRTMEKLRPDLPEAVTIDITSLCNLKCPLCPTGIGTIKLPQSLMSLADFKSYVDKISSLKYLSLFNWGESFLNSHIFDMIEYAKSKNIFVNIDSNFSFELSDYKLLRIINSGLDALRISLDGATAASYNQYRKNGDFNLVYTNLKRLRNLQQEQGGVYPKIIWKFIINKYNQTEIEQAKKMAQEIDVEIFFDKIGLADDIVDLSVMPATALSEKKANWLPDNKELVRTKYLSGETTEKICPMLFKNIFIHSDGQVLPCCYTANETSFMGNLKQQTLSEIWNSNKYLYARSLFYPETKIKRESVVCEHCQLFSGNSSQKL